MDGGGATAPLVFEDPRGLSPTLPDSALAGSPAGSGLPPFTGSVTLHPRTGDCVLFPPWLPHRVGGEEGGVDYVRREAQPEDDDGEPRVSFAFNLVGPWGAATPTLHHAGTP